MNNNYPAPHEVLGYLKAKQIKQEDVAKFLGIGRTTLNRKLNGTSEFKISEIKQIHEQFNVPIEKFLEDSN